MHFIMIYKVGNVMGYSKNGWSEVDIFFSLRAERTGHGTPDAVDPDRILTPAAAAQTRKGIKKQFFLKKAASLNFTIHSTVCH
jgi:hypothetical protein